MSLLACLVDNVDNDSLVDRLINVATRADLAPLVDFVTDFLDGKITGIADSIVIEEFRPWEKQLIALSKFGKTDLKKRKRLLLKEKIFRKNLFKIANSFILDIDEEIK